MIMTQRGRHLDMQDGPERDRAHDEAVASVAAEIRAAYVREYKIAKPWGRTYGDAHMPQWDGGTNRAGDNKQAIWPKIAVLLISRGADPVTFVHAQFFLHAGGQPPKPNYLLRAEAWANYARHAEVMVKDLRDALKRQQLMYQTRLAEMDRFIRLTPAERVINTLCDEHNWEGSPLFRYTQAVAADLPKVAAYFYDRAFVQYVFQQAAYDTAWAEFPIPAPLRAAASRFRGRLN